DQGKAPASGVVNAPVPVTGRTGMPRLVWAAAVIVVLAGAAWAWSVWGRGQTRAMYAGALFTAGDFAADPRVSPNGGLVAMQTMVDGQTQIALLQPESGDYTLL